MGLIKFRKHVIKTGHGRVQMGKIHHAAVGKYNTGLRFERVVADIAGPFPVTDDGNHYITIVGDYFTSGWKPMPSHT